jgi:molybdopterin molybdotransferase
LESEVLGLILAGGQSRRLQALNLPKPPGLASSVATPFHKAMIHLAGRPLLDWVFARIRPQVTRTLLACGPSPDPFAAWGLPCLPDQWPGQPGPLAGVHAGLVWATTEINQGRMVPESFLLVLPCDTPFLPRDTVARMLTCGRQAGAPIVAAASPRGPEWGLLLISLAARDRLIGAAESGLGSSARSLEAWCKAVGYLVCSFDEARAFTNLNTPEDLAAAEARIQAPQQPEDASLAAHDPLRTARLEVLRPGSAPLATPPERPLMTSELSGALSAFGTDAIPVAQMRTILLRCLNPVSASLEQPLTQLAGHVAASALTAPVAVPAQNNAALDGYALRSGDLVHTRSLPRSQAPAILAGHPLSDSAESSPVTLRVMTGGVLPAGFDIVIAQEHAEWLDGHLQVPSGITAGTNVRLRGEDLVEGDAVLTPGCLIGPAEVGLLASLGIGRALVRAPLRVALISTGDELLDPMQVAQADRRIGRDAGQIFDSNRYCLRALLSRWPAIQLTDAGTLGDRVEVLEQTLIGLAREHDLIISSGGVSVGEADVVRLALKRLGEVNFCALAMRPGRPFAVGKVAGAVYFGLPGNPVAATLSFCVLVAPAIDRLLGRTPRLLPLESGRASNRVAKKPGRTEFLRSSLSVDAEGTTWVEVASGQGSGILSSLSRYPAVAVLDHAWGVVEAGEPLTFVRLSRLFAGE